MRKINVLFVLFILLLSSCSINTETKIVFKEDSIYSRATSKEVWYTLVYTSDNNTNIKRHIESKNINLYLPNNRTTFVALYPNGNGYPLTGVKIGNQKIVNLSYEYSDIISIIIDLNTDFSNIVKNSNFNYILDCYNKVDIKYIFDKERFAYDFLYSRINENSFLNIEPWWVSIGTLPQGIYICDNPKVDNIIVTSESINNVVKLSPGVYNYICDKQGIIVTVYVNDLDEITNNEINTYIEISKI